MDVLSRVVRRGRVWLSQTTRLPWPGSPTWDLTVPQVWRRSGGAAMSLRLDTARGADSSPGWGAPSHLELRHSLQVLGCSAGGRPPSPARAIAPDNSGRGLPPTALGCRLGPLVVRGSGQWSGAPPPPHLGVILGPSTRPNPALQRAEFFRIFGACGAAPRGGGGAPPTTLILLRNQRTRRSRARAPPSGPVRGVAGGARGWPPSEPGIWLASL